jgi:hypothetical protein
MGGGVQPLPPPHMAAKGGRFRPAVTGTLGYTEIMGPIFGAGIWGTAVGCGGNPSKVRLRVALTEPRIEGYCPKPILLFPQVEVGVTTELTGGRLWQTILGGRAMRPDWG